MYKRKQSFQTSVKENKRHSAYKILCLLKHLTSREVTSELQIFSVQSVKVIQRSFISDKHSLASTRNRGYYHKQLKKNKQSKWTQSLVHTHHYISPDIHLDSLPPQYTHNEEIYYMLLIFLFIEKQRKPYKDLFGPRVSYFHRLE